MKRSYLFGALGLGLIFTGCSSEDIIENINKPLEADQTFYVSLRISGDVAGLGSRDAEGDGNPVADDFASGTGNESTIDKAFFVFYDDNGNTVGDVVDLEINKDTKWETSTLTGTVEKYYKDVAKVSVTKGEKAPTQVICYLNPVNPGNLKVSLGEIQTLQLETVVKGSDESARFPMSNSVYYDDNAAVPNIAVPLTLGTNVFTTEKEAEDAKEADHCAEIFVERYTTKLTFDATKAVQSDFVTGQRVWGTDGKELAARNKITLHFNPQYWAVNAEAKTSYVIKSFRKEELGSLAPSQYNYTWTDLNGIINKDLSDDNLWWVWNVPTFHRSYWGMSPAYFTNKYPEVSSDLDPKHSELQKYISYNELSNGKGYPVGTVNSQYFKETTVGSVALGSKNPAAAVASVIYVGQYNVTLNGTAVPGNPGFYTYLSGPVPGASTSADNQPYIYFENVNNSLASTVTGAESMLKRFLIQCSILYKLVDGKYVVYEIGDGTGLNGLASKLEVSQLTDKERFAYNISAAGEDTTEDDTTEDNGSEGETDTPKELKLQHNARTLRFKSVPTEDDNIYVLTYKGYKKVVDDKATPNDNELTFTQANIALAKNVGFSYYYTTGHAYFNIPVKHFGWYRKGNLNRYTDAGVLLENETLDWSKVQVGDFGMVRNHAYSVEVGKINGLALGIGGDDVELVPPASETNYFVSYKVNILKWAIVPTQGVDL